MKELLKLLGFEDATEPELREIEEVFSRFGITGEDVETGKQRLRKYYSMDLRGVRGAFSLCFKDLINIVMAREKGKKRIIYYFMSPGFETLGTALTSKSKDIFVANIAATIQVIIGCVFNKLVPILKAAEDRWLKEGKAYHCGNVKSLVGLLSLKIIPRPDLLVTSGQLCDTAPKTIDLIQELYNIPTCSLDTCQDREFREYPDSSRILELSAKSAKYLIDKIEEVVGFEITPEMIMESFNARSVTRDILITVQKLQTSSDPVPLRANHEILWHCLDTMPLSIPDLKKPADVLQTVYSEVKEMSEKGKGSAEKGAPRVLSILPVHFSDPRWEYIPYECGLALVSTELGIPPAPEEDQVKDKDGEASDEGYRPDPYALIYAAAESPLAQNLTVRTNMTIEVCRRLNIEGLICRYHVGCRIGVPDALVIKEEIVKELGIPVLLLDWEGFDPRTCNEDRYRIQLESFRDVIMSRRHSE